MLDLTIRFLFPMITLLSLGGSIRWNKAPLRVAFFAWSAASKKIITMDNLRKRYIIMAKWCYMCKNNGESVDHLLLHCEIASALWYTTFSGVGLVLVMPRKVVNLFVYWRAPGGRFQLNAVWTMILTYLLWCLWREINDRSIEEHERTLVKLKALFFKTLFHCCLKL